MYVTSYYIKLCNIAKDFGLELENHNLCNIDKVIISPDCGNIHFNYNEIKSNKLNKSIKDEITDIVTKLFDGFSVNGNGFYDKNTLEYSVFSIEYDDDDEDGVKNKLIGSIYVEVYDHHLELFIDNEVLDYMDNVSVNAC